MWNINSRRVATLSPYQRRTLGTRIMSAHVGVISWTTMPGWYKGWSI